MHFKIFSATAANILQKMIPLDILANFYVLKYIGEPDIDPKHRNFPVKRHLKILNSGSVELI